MSDALNAWHVRWSVEGPKGPNSWRQNEAATVVAETLEGAVAAVLAHAAAKGSVDVQINAVNNAGSKVILPEVAK